jgi:hypothetical protein
MHCSRRVVFTASVGVGGIDGPREREVLRRIVRLWFAAVALVVLWAGSAAADLVQVGQFNWDDEPTFGSSFLVANQSDTLDPWAFPGQAGPFDAVVLRLFSDAGMTAEMLPPFEFDRPLFPGDRGTTLDDPFFELAFGAAMAATVELVFTPAGPGTPPQEVRAVIAGVCTQLDQEGCLTVGPDQRSGTALLYARLDPVPVPEPTALWLLGGGIGALAVRRRRR